MQEREKPKRHGNEAWIINILNKIFDQQIANARKIRLFTQVFNQQIKCHGFPEFNPQNHLELSGYLNYLLDVFNQPQIKITVIATYDSSVVINFRITGKHHEEFMGLAASNGLLQLNANIRFILRNNLISEIHMQDKKVRLTTCQGMVYELIHHQSPAAQPLTPSVTYAR